MDLSDIFSRLLLHYKQFDHLDRLGKGNIAGNQGHGPLVDIGQNHTAFDLRCNEERWVYGHSHPLYLKSLVSALENSLPNQKFHSSKLSEINSNIPWENQYAYHSFRADLLCFLKENSLPIFWVDESTVWDQDEFESLITKMNALDGKLVIIEKNTLNLHSSGSVVLHRLLKAPQIYINNFCLPLYSIYTHDPLPSQSSEPSANLIICQNFVKYIREAQILGAGGLIDGRNKQLTSFLAQLVQKWQLHGTCLSLNARQQAQALVEEKGLLCDFKHSKLIINLPLTLKSDQMSYICKSVKELDQCSF